MRSAESSVEEESDLEDIRVRYGYPVTTTRRMRNRRDLAIEPG